MFQYRQVLVRLRAGDTAREIARSGLLGRDKITELVKVAQARAWLDAAAGFVASAGDSLSKAAAGAQSLTAWLAMRKDGAA